MKTFIFLIDLFERSYIRVLTASDLDSAIAFLVEMETQTGPHPPFIPQERISKIIEFSFKADSYNTHSYSLIAQGHILMTKHWDVDSVFTKDQLKVKTLLERAIRLNLICIEFESDYEIMINPCGNLCLRIPEEYANEEFDQAIQEFANTNHIFLEDRPSLDRNLNEIEGYMDYEFIV